MYVQKNDTLKMSWYQNFSKSQKCVFKKMCIKIYLDRRSQKCMLKNMKLSKSPDIKISLQRRSQKCVFKNWNCQKVLISKFLYTGGLKNECSKNETLKKSWYQNSLQRRSQKCVFKKNETLKKSWYQSFPKQVSKMCVHKNWSSQKVLILKMYVQKMKLSKSPDIKFF